MTSELATQLTVTQSVAYSILSASETETAPSWKAWSADWLKGADRSAAAAEAAAAEAKTVAARHAAMAARLFAESTAFQTEAALLGSEGRNASWQLDAQNDRESRCLAEVAEAIRHAEVKDLSRLLATAESEF